MIPLLAAALAPLEAAGVDVARLHALRALEPPSARAEAWRYFPLRQLALRRPVAAPTTVLPESAVPEALTLRWLDGQLDHHQRDVLAGTGVTVGRAAVDTRDHEFFGALAQQLSTRREHIRIAHHLPQPLRLEYRCGSAAVSACDVVLQLAPGVEATVIEDLRGAEREHAALSLLKVRIGAGARLTWLRLLDDDARSLRVAHSRFQLSSRAQLHWYGLDQRTGISRHELDVLCKGKGASASLRGGAVVDGREFTEHRLQLLHNAPGCDSNTLWKLVGRGQSRAVFNGRIEISAGADHTDAQLRTANLLLSEQAEIDCKPELEIHADEVRASHGATVGQLDERALFYLRSRGIGAGEARDLLIGAFVRELFDDLPEGPLRQAVEQALERRLPALDLAA